MDIPLMEYSFEQLAHAMFKKGELEGYPNVMAKNKWREVIMADHLGHDVFKKTSSGRKTIGYGADAVSVDGKTVEYKSSSLSVDQYMRLLDQRPITVSGIYNGAYTLDSIIEYQNHDHYFGLFFEERCLMILQVDTTHVIDTLFENLYTKSMKVGKTTNLNTVSIKLTESSKYEIAYDNIDLVQY